MAPSTPASTGISHKRRFLRLICRTKKPLGEGAPAYGGRHSTIVQPCVRPLPIAELMRHKKECGVPCVDNGECLLYIHMCGHVPACRRSEWCARPRDTPGPRSP